MCKWLFDEFMNENNKPPKIMKTGQHCTLICHKCLYINKPVLTETQKLSKESLISLILTPVVENTNIANIRQQMQYSFQSIHSCIPCKATSKDNYAQVHTAATPTSNGPVAFTSNVLLKPQEFGSGLIWHQMAVTRTLVDYRL
jgi:hypothetical protein